MRIALGNDHRGYQLKLALKKALADLGHEPVDFGCDSVESVDYPDFAEKAATAVATRDCEFGVLVCSTGIGMSMAANKVPGIRAALCPGTLAAQRTREHNNANVLCIGADFTAPYLAVEVLKTFLATGYEGGRHERRVQKIAAIEKKLSGETLEKSPLSREVQVGRWEGEGGAAGPRGQR